MAVCALAAFDGLLGADADCDVGGADWVGEGSRFGFWACVWFDGTDLFSECCAATGECALVVGTFGLLALASAGLGERAFFDWLFACLACAGLAACGADGASADEGTDDGVSVGAVVADCGASPSSLKETSTLCDPD